MTTNIFTDVVLSAVVKKLISEAGKSALESIKNSNTNVIQEQLKAIGVETQNIFSSASEEGISLLTDNLKQVVYQILVNVDIPEFNKTSLNILGSIIKSPLIILYFRWGSDK